MSLKIEVTVPTEVIQEDRASSYVDRALGAIGFGRPSRTDWGAAVSALTGMMNRTENKPAPGLSGAAVRSAIVDEAASGAGETPAAEPVKAEEPAPAPVRRGRKPRDAAPVTETSAPAEPRQISTGEERTGPEDDPAVIEQDDADERAESEAKAPSTSDRPLTRDDLRNVMAGYLHKFGADATQEDGPKILKAAIGEPPAGVPAWKLSLVPEDRFADAVAAWKQATQDNPFDRKAVS